MMDKRKVIDFFDSLAPLWDERNERNDRIIGEILDCGEVSAGKRIFDAACGTGVLFPDYLKRNVRSVTAADISPEMARLAAEKNSDPRIRVICADVTEYATEERFDCVMLYNALPHFPDAAEAVEKLAGLLDRGGRLTVAHGASRETIDSHHKGSAKDVSMGLMSETELSRIMSRFLKVDTAISDEEKYIVSGVLL